MRKVCQYAIIQFMPHPETREFANVGVVMLCPQENFFGFRLLKKYGRVTRFFEQMDNSVYIEGKRIFQDELVRLQQIFNTNIEGNREATGFNATRLFAELTREREGIFRFDAAATVLATDAKEKLNELYMFYIEREFVTKEYQEHLMEKSVKKILFDADLAKKFKGGDIGDDLYHVRFPFVALDDHRKTKVIKPLALDQGEPTKIFAHADNWLPKIRRLRERNLLPEAVLFPVTPPPANDEMCKLAYDEVCNELKTLDVQVATFEEQQKILSFAKG